MTHTALYRAIIPVAALSLCLTPLAASSASAASSPAVDSAAEAPFVSDLVPVDASLGGRADLVGAKIEALDARGRVLQTVTTGARGGAHLSRAKVKNAVTLRVTGGTSELSGRNNATLYGRMQMHPERMRVQHVTPVTTLATMVAQKRKQSYSAGMRAVRNHLEIPHWANEWQHTHASHLFDAVEFAEFVKKRGGVRQALAALEREILRGGKKTRSFGDQVPQPRSVGTFAGELLFTAVIEASTGQSPDQLIGTLTGTQDPTDTALANIESELAQIASMLVTIEADMNEMLAEIAVTQYDTIAASLTDIRTSTESAWTVYHNLVNDVDPSDRETYEDYANEFYESINPNIAEFGALFTTAGSTGLLDELYQMNAVEYPWWTSDDILNMQSTIDYYGTLQAQAVTLLSEAWNFSSPTYTHNKTKTFISGQLNALYSPQSANIYRSMPDSLSAGEVVNPANRRAYKLAPYTQPNAAYQQWGSLSGYATCSNNLNVGSGYTKTPTASSATISGWWTAATPAGYTSAASSEMTFLSTQRSTTTNGKTTSSNALPTMTVNAPSAWVMVSNQAQPLLSLYKITSYSYYGWMYCNNSSVSLVSSQLQKFVQNALMTQGGSYVPSGLGLNWNSTIPVALLVSRSGQFSYVPPTS